jgi:hypothetical protein
MRHSHLVIITKMETAYKFYSFQQIPQPNFDAAMEELADMFQKALKDNLAKPYPYAPGYFGQKPKTGTRNMKKKTGNLYNSINVSFDPATNRMKVNMLNYWKYVNDGRQPGKYVPLKPLMDWIRVKGLNRDKSGRFKKFNVKGTAFAISKTIQKFGIQPTNFYDDSFDVFIKAFDDPNGPAAKLGMDLQEFLIKIIQEP